MSLTPTPSPTINCFLPSSSQEQSVVWAPPFPFPSCIIYYVPAELWCGYLFLSQLYFRLCGSFSISLTSPGGVSPRLPLPPISLYLSNFWRAQTWPVCSKTFLEACNYLHVVLLETPWQKSGSVRWAESCAVFLKLKRGKIWFSFMLFSLPKYSFFRIDNNWGYRETL